MSNPDSTQLRFAYLTARHLDSIGACGGLLLVNQVGRPVEFHCTSPVQANRTQQILYGRSLSNYIFTDQIGGSLMAELKQKPDLVLVNCRELLDLPSHIDFPVVYVSDPSAEGPCPSQNMIHHSIEVDGRMVSLMGSRHDISSIQGWLSQLNGSVPIDEPFERITQALDEAHAVAR